MRPEREGRPTRAEVEAASISTAIKSETSVALATDHHRCRHCGHPIWSAASIAAGLGKDCRRAARLLAGQGVVA